MASKRKSEPQKKTTKRNKKKVDNDFDSDLSDEFDTEGNGNSEILIHNDALEPLAKLPEDLLATMDKEPGKLLIAGMVTWDLTGRRDNSKVTSKIRPNLYVFNRFTDEKYRLAVSGCSSAHSVLVNMDRKALTFGESKSLKNLKFQSIIFIIFQVVISLANWGSLKSSHMKNQHSFLVLRT